MRAFAIFFSLLLAAGLLHAGEVIPEIRTLTGKKYQDCTVVNLHPDGVSFRHATGAARVLFTDLHASWRQKWGYDPERAASYQEEIEAKRQALEDRRQRLDQERTQAMKLAEQIELAQLHAQEIRARAMLAAAAKAPPPAESPVPALAPIGAVFDSRDYYGRGYRNRWPGLGYGYGLGYGWPWGYGGGVVIGQGGGRWCPPHSGGRPGGTSFIIRR